MNVNGGKEAKKFLFHWRREVGYVVDMLVLSTPCYLAWKQTGPILELRALNMQMHPPRS